MKYVAFTSEGAVIFKEGEACQIVLRNSDHVPLLGSPEPKVPLLPPECRQRVVDGDSLQDQQASIAKILEEEKLLPTDGVALCSGENGEVMLSWWETHPEWAVWPHGVFRDGDEFVAFLEGQKVASLKA